MAEENKDRSYSDVDIEERQLYTGRTIMYLEYFQALCK
jgi:hypothetical protein